MAKGDWVQGTTIWINQLVVTSEAGIISGITVSYSIVLPSGTVFGYQLQRPLGDTPQSEVMQAIADAINAVLVFEGIPL